MANADDVLERLEQVAQGLGRGWREMACADCKHYGKGWRDDVARCRWDPAEGWPLVYAVENYPVVNEWDGEGCPQFKERTDGE